jgi:hypothetical protein
MKHIVNASLVGLIVASLFVVGITIGADLYLPLKDSLKNTYGHHWVGKSILTFLVFVGTTLIMYPLMKRVLIDAEPIVMRIAGYGAIISALMLTLFFVYEYTIP